MAQATITTTTGIAAEPLDPTSLTEPRSPFLTLPNELIHKICTHLDRPHTFFSLSQVNRRLSEITHTTYTRRAFADQWLETYCDGDLNKGPHIIKYIIRFVRLHSKAPHNCLCRKDPLADPALIEPPEHWRSPYRNAQWRTIYEVHPLPADHFFFDLENEQPNNMLLVATDLPAPVRKRILDHLAASMPASIMPPGDVPATMKNMKLEVDDIVLAEVMLRRAISTRDLYDESEKPERKSWFHTDCYFSQWQWCNDNWDCGCAVNG